METDYYLHNFHVKTGKGITQSMKGYQFAFGVVDWHEDDDLDASNDRESALSSASLPSTKIKRPQLPHSRNATVGSVDSAVYKPEDKLRRIARVRSRCRAQNLALSSWWKIAIQSNIQQRMWMQLGSSPSESLLPPRFERLYQPEKMAQFDRFFARSWATPVRRSHPAQQGEGSDDENDLSEFRRNISGRATKKIIDHSKEESKNVDHPGARTRNTLLREFVSRYHASREEPTLKAFVEYHNISDRFSSASEKKEYGKFQDLTF